MHVETFGKASLKEVGVVTDVDHHSVDGSLMQPQRSHSRRIDGRGRLSGPT